MSSLTSYENGSLGAAAATSEGSLGSGPNMTAIHNGTLGEYFSSGVSGLGNCGCSVSGLGFIDALDTPMKKYVAGVAAVAALYYVAKKTKLIKNKRRRRGSRRRR